jgi:alkylation response protein AidB-like acyl-CoA dehydrogenase
MFVMMNAARLHVALQGIGLLDAAWQKAQAYAHERRQMRAPRRQSSQVAAGGSLIIEHPAIQRILDTQRAWIDGGACWPTRPPSSSTWRATTRTPLAAPQAQRWCALVDPRAQGSLHGPGLRWRQRLPAGAWWPRLCA